MPKNKIGPYLLIGILLLILFFTLGVRLGQKVEKTNKVIDYLVSIKPTQKVPSVTPPAAKLGFATYANNNCGIKFLYPNALKIIQTASNSATFNNQDKREDLVVSCDKFGEINTKLKDPNITTTEASFKNKKIVVKQMEGNNSLRFFIFSFKNPLNGKNIFVQIESSLYPLFESTLQFINK